MQRFPKSANLRERGMRDGAGRDQDMPVRCIRDIEKPLYTDTGAAHQMSIASAEPDQHHGTRLITTCSSLIIFTDCRNLGVGCVGRSVPSQAFRDHTGLSILKSLVRLQAGKPLTLDWEKDSKFQRSRPWIGDAKRWVTLNGM